MSDELGPKQEISAGDSSANYQVARDLTVHNHAASPVAQSLIERPTNKQIVAFDPKTREIIEAASKMWLRLEWSEKRDLPVPAYMIALTICVVAGAIVFGLATALVEVLYFIF